MKEEFLIQKLQKKGYILTTASSLRGVQVEDSIGNNKNDKFASGGQPRRSRRGEGLKEEQVVGGN